MQKEITRQEYVVSVGADWSKTKIYQALSASMRGIKEFVSNPKHNHFKITVESLRKGSKTLAQANIRLARETK